MFVIDAKRYQGRPHLHIRGGLLTPRTETLIVGRRDCSKLAQGVLRQVDLVRSTLPGHPKFADVPLSGMLCFIEADWPLIGGSFLAAGIDVWLSKAAAKLAADGPLSADAVDAVHKYLAAKFPSA